MKKVVIIGAGPCGLLFALNLLTRPQDYAIEIYEKLGDPRQVSLSQKRTIPYGLNNRGFQALRKIEGLEDALKCNCVENYGVVFHASNGKETVSKKTTPTYNTDRNSLIVLLLNQLMELGKNKDFHISFNCTAKSFNLSDKTIDIITKKDDLEQETRVNYDILIGADGARSEVRNKLLNTQFFEFQQQYVNALYKTVFLLGDGLKSNYLHVWRLEEGIVFGAVPQIDGSFIGLLFFPQKDNFVHHLDTETKVRQFFDSRLSQVSPLVTEEEIKSFLERPKATQLKVRCNRYHHQDQILILGDAAHAVSSSLGQGCNNAFEDVYIFDQLLDKHQDNWQLALTEFTEVRKADNEALWELDTNVFPSGKLLFFEFMLREKIAKCLNKMLPQFFAPALRDSLTEGKLSYAEILKNHQAWITKVKNFNDKFNRS